MKWIVGLGNPGAAYSATRHNIGFMALDLLTEQLGIRISQNKCKAQIGEGIYKGEKLYFIQPMTFMNLSGESVRAFMTYHKADLADLIVLYDDLDTPFGQFRLRYQGGAGGHNGIKSIIQHLGTPLFNRVRIGISRPDKGADIADYVLSRFTKDENAELPNVLKRVCDALQYALDEPFEKTMAKFNS